MPAVGTPAGTRLASFGSVKLFSGGIFSRRSAVPVLVPPDRSKWTILVIDDDVEMLNSIRPMLQAVGFNVLTSSSGPKGLDILRYAQKDVGVVLLDYNMPRFSGADTLTYLRQLAPNAKIIALTGVASELLPESYRASVDRLMPKPFRSKELLACIDELLNLVPTPA